MKKYFIKINTKKIINIFVIFLIFIFTFSFSFLNITEGAINKEINYQGKLTTSDNIAVANGTYAMEFKLYTVDTGGTAIWTETRTAGDEVTVTNGLFSIMLGEVAALTSVDFNQTLYLGVKIESDAEMTPRKKLGSVPAAFVAETVTGAAQPAITSLGTLTGLTMGGNINLATNKLLGGTGTTDDLFFQTTTGVGTTGADMHFLVGNNGATEAMTILNSGYIGIGTNNPQEKLHIYGSGAQRVEVESTDNSAAFKMTTSASSFGFFASNSDNRLSIYDYGSSSYLFSMLGNGNLGIGAVTDPTARFHLPTGTATAGTAPLKLTAGTNLTTPEAGAMEWDGTNLFVTQTTGPTRKTIAYTSDIVNSPITIVNTSNLFSTGLTGTGSGVTATDGSVFLGIDAGNGATSADYSNFFGYGAGQDAVYAANSNFLGSYSGWQATNAQSSNFLGANAGDSATNAANSNFFGLAAGYGATNALHSNFFGTDSGYEASNASRSNLFGYHVGKTFTGNNIGSNNIIIGTNISLPNATTNAINLGGVLFAKNTYATTTGDPSITGTATGSIGIGVTPANISARLHLPAGTATAGTAPLKLTSGTLLTTAEAGAVEFLTDAFYGTITTGAARKTFAFLESPVFTTQITTALIYGSSSASGNLTLASTSNATKGKILFGSSGYDEVNDRLGVGTASPSEKIEVVGNIYINNSGGYLKFYNGFKFTDGTGTVTVSDSTGSAIMIFDEL